MCFTSKLLAVFETAGKKILKEEDLSEHDVKPLQLLEIKDVELKQESLPHSSSPGDTGDEVWGSGKASQHLNLK